MSSKIKLPKKPSTATLTKLLRLAVRLRDQNRCRVCGKEVEGSNSQPAHLLSKKAYPGIRYLLPNVVLACFACHKGARHSFHEDPLAMQEWVAKEFGPDYLQKLRLTGNLTPKVDRWAVKLYLEAEIKKLKGDC